MSWPLVALDSIAQKVDYGLTASAIEKKDGPRFLRITDLQDDSVNWDSVPSCECSEKDLRDNSLANGDIVFARTGATTGKSYLIRDLPQPSVFASYLIRVKPSDRVDSLYLSYFFKSPKYWYQITNMANGAAQPGVNSSKLKELEIPLPPLAEQKRIAAILDKADAIRRKRQQAIQLADEFLRATFLDMFGDPILNPKKWEVRELKQLSSKILNGTTPKGGKENYVREGITFFRSQNVWKRKIVLDDIAFLDDVTHKKMNKSSLKHKDILMTKTGRFNTENSSLGRAAMFMGEDDSANINGHVYLIRLNTQVINEFVLFILTTDEYREYIRRVCVGGIDKRQLNKEHIEQFPIIYPPLELQNQFAAAMRATELVKEQALSSLDESEKLFKSLSQKVFSGKL